MVKGTAKFDGIAIGEFTVNFLDHTTKLHAKAAFVASESGLTHGWTTNEQWTPTTMEKLRELRTAMENDLAAIHFSGAFSAGNVPSADTRSTGLGEFLTDREGRSI